MKGLMFIGLNVADAYLTKTALAMGAIELNPLGVFWSSMLIKGLIAAAIVVGLYFWGKERALSPLCLAMFGICCWNLAMCFIGQMAGCVPPGFQYLAGIA
jgi:hypothetical protein